MNFIYAILFDVVIFGLLLLTSYLLYRFGKKFPYVIKVGVMTIVFLVSFIALFMQIKSPNDVYIPFFI